MAIAADLAGVTALYSAPVSTSLPTHRLVLAARGVLVVAAMLNASTRTYARGKPRGKL